MTDYSSYTTDYIKGKADIFSYAIEVLDNCMENRKELSSGEFLTMIDTYADTPLKKEGVGQYYFVGSDDAINFIYDYFNGRDYGLLEYTIKDTYNMIEEEFDYVLQELKKRGVI
jgi:hypothetical protein